MTKILIVYLIVILIGLVFGYFIGGLIVLPKYESNTGNLLISNQSITNEAILIIAYSNGSETLRIDANGSIYHNGKFVGNDSEIPELLKQALKGSLN